MGIPPYQLVSALTLVCFSAPYPDCDVGLAALPKCEDVMLASALDTAERTSDRADFHAGRANAHADFGAVTGIDLARGVEEAESGLERARRGIVGERRYGRRRSRTRLGCKPSDDRGALYLGFGRLRHGPF